MWMVQSSTIYVIKKKKEHFEVIKEGEGSSTELKG
jgi:hypothetical protein